MGSWWQSEASHGSYQQGESSSPHLVTIDNYYSSLQMNLLLKEYLSSSDCSEVIRCLRELEVPHFHHELVYEAVVMVMENATEVCAEMMSTLLLHLYQTGMVSSDQFTTVSNTSSLYMGPM